MQDKNALTLALEQRERLCYEFEAANFLGLGGRPVGKYKIRVVTKGEQDRAVLAAYKYVEELAKAESLDPKAIGEDRDILTDAKTCHILFEACRDAADPKYPAFPGPGWMIGHLSTDEISVLLNHYNEVLRRSGTIESDFSDDRVAAIAALLAQHSDTDAPNLYLVRYTREQLAELCILLALRAERACRAADVANIELATARADYAARTTESSQIHA